MPENLFYQFEKRILLIIAAFCFLYCTQTVEAQDIEAKIKVLQTARVQIAVKFVESKNVKIGNQISFLQNYADVSALGERVENLNLFDEAGAKIEYKKSSAGEFQAQKTPASFEYEVKTELPVNPLSAAHVSWLAENQGLLMTGDLLPKFNGGQKISAKIVFEIPDDWAISTSETKIGANIFSVENVERAIFFIGQNQREKTQRIDKSDLHLATLGEWQFSDDEAAEMAREILTEYKKFFGDIPVKQAQIFLLPFPRALNAERWRAETRGATVTIISGALPTKREALQHLHEQLRHEIFHLWIPNAVALTGNYDWFYEGFTVYQALRAGIWTNQIRFQDYLNTLSQAFELAKNQNISLIEMSDKRWTGTYNSVYARGMLAAFLCDLAMLEKSKGGRSIEEIFQKVYRKYRAPNPSADGNTAILEILESYPELQTIIKKYVRGASKIEWRNELETFGIEIDENDGGMRLKVGSNLTKRQKDLLDKLGYNQWRKLLQAKK